LDTFPIEYYMRVNMTEPKADAKTNMQNGISEHTSNCWTADTVVREQSETFKDLSCVQHEAIFKSASSVIPDRSICRMRKSGQLEASFITETSDIFELSMQLPILNASSFGQQ